VALYAYQVSRKLDRHSSNIKVLPQKFERLYVGITDGRDFFLIEPLR
jgi:hypothetical protein